MLLPPPPACSPSPCLTVRYRPLSEPTCAQGPPVDAQVVPQSRVGLGGQWGLCPAVREKGSRHRGVGSGSLYGLGPRELQLLMAQGRAAFWSGVRASSCLERTCFPGLCRPLLLRASCAHPSLACGQGQLLGCSSINLLYSLLRPGLSPKYVTLEQLKAMWGTSPMPAAPVPGLPLWAPASRDLVPTTCLPPVLPSSSSFASITPSPKVGGLCVPATPSPLLAWLCVYVCVCPCARVRVCVCSAPASWLLSSRLAPWERSVPADAGCLASWWAQHVSLVWELCPDCSSLPLARSQQLFSHCFSPPSLYAVLSPLLPSLLPHLRVSLLGLPLLFLQPSPFFCLLSRPPTLPSPTLLTILLTPSPRPSPYTPLQIEELLLPAVDLEQWYQELMAGLGTGPATASPRSSPPPLPAKASRQLQVTPSLPARSSPSPAPLCAGYLLPMQQPHGASLEGGGPLSQGSRSPSAILALRAAGASP